MVTVLATGTPQDRRGGHRGGSGQGRLPRRNGLELRESEQSVDP